MDLETCQPKRQLTGFLRVARVLVIFVHPFMILPYKRDAIKG